MASDIQDTVRQLLIGAIESAGKNSNGAGDSGSGGGLSGARGLAAGVGAAALAPIAVKGIGKLVKDMGIEGLEELVKSPGKAVQGLTSDVGDHLGSQLGDKISSKVDDAGGPAGILKEMLPFGGGGGGAKGGGLGIGRGRRMPVQQSIDVGVPRETAYNQWTQYEDWPQFMHRVTRVTQEDETAVSFAVKIWGKTKEFTAKIETQRPDERVKWRVSQGITHAGVVTFHELGPNLTRVLLDLDVAPGGMLEKAARGMRHIKRAARGDLHRFKAFIEMAEHETGAWRGRIEDGEVVEEHDPSYDDEREYSDPEAFDEDSDDDEGSEDSEQDSDDDQDEEDEESTTPRARRTRRQRQSSSNGHGGDEEPPTRARTQSRGSGRAAASRQSSASRTAGRSSGSKSSGSKSSAAKSSAASSSRRAASGSAAKSKSSGSARKSSGGAGSGSSRRASGSGTSGGRTRSRTDSK